MALLSSSDLKFTYSWTTVKPDDPRITGEPDNAELNRHEGYEVLAFLNRMANASHWVNKEPALKAERLIREKLPANVRSRQHVWQWIADHWND
jgi:hypothetical protein